MPRRPSKTSLNEALFDPMDEKKQSSCVCFKWKRRFKYVHIKCFFGIYTDAMSGHIIVMSCYIAMIHDMGVLCCSMLCCVKCNVMSCNVLECEEMLYYRMFCYVLECCGAVLSCVELCRFASCCVLCVM